MVLSVFVAYPCWRPEQQDEYVRLQRKIAYLAAIDRNLLGDFYMPCLKEAQAYPK